MVQVERILKSHNSNLVATHIPRQLYFHVSVFGATLLLTLLMKKNNMRFQALYVGYS